MELRNTLLGTTLPSLPAVADPALDDQSRRQMELRTGTLLGASRHFRFHLSRTRRLVERGFKASQTRTFGVAPRFAPSERLYLCFCLDGT
ncbi:glycerophosphodiester phosphodiesterase [Pseudozyma hubeiensis SY62]|uniref:Glycerophosphodiester phosphodiesterase n=1 Tax=Pseudozyma hubeiensis (strain SY62) TaxID=1305764 RepID=R9NYQ4_PSEHS|nr:glycerophosphodiester phosphodiesterase [Pseudozyma hubeiensis SY62]GAC93834.1 glycerophosphodiester phosphodiesterase [Pseudozyma hubeiensis SY62]